MLNSPTLALKAKFFIYASSLTLFSASAYGANFIVNSTSDSASPPVGTVTLRSAITQANASPGSTITFDPSLSGASIVLSSSLPPVTQNVGIFGPSNPVTVNGNSVGQIFYISKGGSAVSATITNLNLENGLAQGGDGGRTAAGGGGGGGTGAGGALFVDANATVTVQNIAFTDNSAKGGAGGTSGATGNAGAGGGGFCGGNGGSGFVGGTCGAGGGGGDATGTAGATSTSLAGGAGGNGGVILAGLGTGGAGGTVSVSNGGGGGGGGGAGVNGTPGANGVNNVSGGNGGAGGGTGGGGGAGIASNGATSGVGGAGGFGAGGGGGGFSGGGAVGGNGGAGGFGAGGGGAGLGTGNPGGTGGAGGAFGGGTGGNGGVNTGNGGGGGGSGFGGAVFVRNGGSLTIVDGSISGNSVNQGAGGLGTSAGGAMGNMAGQDIFIMSGGTVNFNVSNSLTIPTIIQSDENAGGGSGGGVIKSGAGKLSLSGNNTYTGSTTIQQGEFNLNGSIIGPVTIQSAGTLSGNATITTVGGNTGNVTNSGMISPGNSIGTVTIANNYTQTAGGAIDIEINAAGASDVIAVTGTASLNGTALFTADMGMYNIGQQGYIFLTAGTVTGQFSSFGFTSNPGGQIVSATILYEPTFAELLVTMAPAFANIIHGGNAGAVAKYLSMLDMNACSDMMQVNNALRALPNSELRSALKQLQPSQFGAFSLVQEQVSILVRSAFSRRTWDLHSTGCLSEETKHYRANVWADGFHQWMDQNDFSGQEGFDANANGAVMGIDYEVIPNFYVGALGSYTHAHLNWDGSLGHGNINTWYGGVYGSWSNNSFFVDTAFLAAANAYDAKRHIHFTGLKRHARSDHHGYEVLASLSTGWSGHIDRFLMQPFARVDYNYLYENSFTEHNAGCIDLDVKRKNADLLRSEIGLNLSYCCDFKSKKVKTKSNTAVNIAAAIPIQELIASLELSPAQSQEETLNSDSEGAPVNEQPIAAASPIPHDEPAVYEKEERGFSIIPGMSLSYVRESRFKGRRYRTAFKDYEETNGFFYVHNNPPSRNLFVPEVNITGFFFENQLTVKVAYSSEIAKHFWEQEVSGHLGWNF